MQHACRIENAVVPGMDMFVRGTSDRYTLCDVILYCVTFCKGGKDRKRERERERVSVDVGFSIRYRKSIDSCFTFF